MDTVCIYHKGCIDGTVAAAVLLMKYPQAKLFGFSHDYKQEDLNELLGCINKNTVVYFLDFFPRSVNDLLNLLEKAKKVVVIDHHISTKYKTEGNSIVHENLEFIFDNNRSGASLTYQYFFGNDKNKLIEFVEDRDLWRWKLGENTEFANNYLFLFVDNPHAMKGVIESCDIEDILSKGKVISEYKNKLLQNILDKSKEIFVYIGDYKVRAYNISSFQSELGNVLAKKYDEPICLFGISDDNVFLSFRSLSHHRPSALDLAKTVGGGGHRDAAGAVVHIRKFFDMLQNRLKTGII
ncbi:MAG: DHHA1 domain-containing protein [Candidatus Bilamarchaeaceae archaeon]